MKKVIIQCRTCRYSKTKALVEKMPPLPDEQVEPSRPFTHVGIDFWDLCKSRTSFMKLRRLKSAVLTCSATRAVQLELTCNMTTESFMLALTRMMSRLGKIDVIWCVNFKSLKNADKALQQCLQFVSSDATLNLRHNYKSGT